jgi:hypothetical protein
MSLPDVTPDQILDAIQQVPTVRWGEVLRAIKSLQDSPDATTSAGSAVRTGTDLRDSALIGIWADRNAIANNHEFARELRRQAEQRK